MSKTIWLPEEKQKMTWEKAMEKFGPGKHPDKVLPTIGQLRRAWEKGIKFNDKNYWSSSVHPDFSIFAYVFDGRNGVIDVGYRGYVYVSVRCVSTKSKKNKRKIKNEFRN